MSEDEDTWKIVWESYPRLVAPPLPELPALPIGLPALPQVNPDRRACPGCVGPGGVAELQRRLAASEAEVARLQRCMRAPLFASGKVFVDNTQTPNERAYDALMAEREKRKRAGRVVGVNLRLQAQLLTLARSRAADAEQLADELQRRASSVPLLEDKIARLKADNVRLLNNEAPLRAGYLEACAERDELRKKQATVYSQAQMNDAGAYEKLRQSHQRAVADAATYREQARHLIDRMADVNYALAQDEKPRSIVKKLRKLLIA